MPPRKKGAPKPAAQPAIVYTYGILDPDSDGALTEINRQMSVGHRYYNNLIRLELMRRRMTRAIRDRLAPDCAQAQEAADQADQTLKELREQLAAKNAKARSRKIDDTDRKAVKATIAALVALRKNAHALRQEAHQRPAIKQAFAAIDERVGAARKRLRKRFKGYWATYCMEEAAFDMAIAAAKKGRLDPSFRPWDGSGRIAVQLQKGLSVPAALAGKDTRLRILVHPATGTSRRRQLRRLTDVSLRIGSDQKRNPVWATIRCAFHRPLPEDATIKWVYIVRRRHGTKLQWTLNITLTRQAGWKKDDLAQEGTVGVDIGWRKFDDGHIRVAVWVGDDGRTGEVALSDDHLSKWEWSEYLQGLRDNLFNSYRGVLADFLDRRPRPEFLQTQADYLDKKAAEEEARHRPDYYVARLRWQARRHRALAEQWERPPEDPPLPAWFVARTQNIAHWRGAGRLNRLVGRWTHSDDLVAIPPWGLLRDVLRSWKTIDQHLWIEEACGRARAIRRRNDLYRNVAAFLRRNYKTIKVEDIDWRELAQKEAIENADKEAGSQRARRQRHLASPGLLSATLCQNVAQAVKVKAAFTSKTCPDCGHENDVDLSAQLSYTCDQCGLTHDQDYAAARNILKG